MGKRGIVTKFNLPIIGAEVSRGLKAGSSDNFLEKARRAVIGTMDDMISNYEEGADENSTTTIADIIGSELDSLLGGIGILESPIDVTYYEHIDDVAVSHSSYDSSLDIKSLQWTIPFGQTITLPLPPLNFKLDGALPLHLKIESENVPTITLEWGFKLAFGFDDEDGFFLNTFPGEDSEFFVRADFDLDVEVVSATLLYFLNITLEDISVEFGAGVFVDIDKESALRKADNSSSVSYGRLTRNDFNKIPNKKDLFQLCAAAAAALDVDDASVSIPESLIFVPILRNRLLSIMPFNRWSWKFRLTPLKR